jgi:hypothetical protein
MRDRSGKSAVNQSFNYEAQAKQMTLNMDNSFLNENMERVRIANVQQINDTAYYQRGRRWVDSRLVQNETEVQPEKVIEFGSEEFIELAQKLAKDNRQGSIALRGDILLLVEGEPVLIRSPVETR